MAEEFFTSPWEPSANTLGSGLSDFDVGDYAQVYNPTPQLISAETTSSNAPPALSDSGFSGLDFSKVISGVTGVADWGLKAANTVFAADAAFKNQQLNRYLQREQIDIFRTKAASDANVARINAETANNIAKIRANASLSGANAVNFGAQGQSGAMFWLTVIGVVFSGIQVYRSAK